MVDVLIDTNILIDYLHGIPDAARELVHYDHGYISAITWMEVMIGTDEQTNAGTRAFLSGFLLLDISKDVSEEAVRVRKATGIKLPDAIIRATANVHGLLLVTRNTKDFPENDPGIRVPYRR